MNRVVLLIVSIFFSLTAYADINDADKSKAWDCSGLYMANYFLPAGETFEYSMKEKSMASVKVLKAYALETGVSETSWDEGVNKAVDKYYGSKYDKAKTNECHTFLEGLIPNGKERVNKVVQTLY
ncbi:hypothetical protein OAQ48_01810 [Candidatus Pelagibacter sp.]|nr:hypothetical protein [Candidatus Pelagibacter sp.]